MWQACDAMGLLIAIGLAVSAIGGLCNGVCQYIIVPHRIAQTRAQAEQCKIGQKTQKQAHTPKTDNRVYPYMIEQLDACNAQITAYTRMIDILEQQAAAETDYMEQTKLWRKAADLQAKCARLSKTAWQLQDKIDGVDS